MPWIPAHKTWQMNLLGQWTPWYQNRDFLHTSTQKVADEPTLANGPPVPEQRYHEYQYTKLADEPTLANVPPSMRQRCLEYQYTKSGRWTHFSQWTLQYQTKMPWLPVHKTWQMNLFWPMNPSPPGTRGEMPWIPVHKTWQMNLLGLMDPPVPEQRWLAYHYTKPGR